MAEVTSSEFDLAQHVTDKLLREIDRLETITGLQIAAVNERVTTETGLARRVLEERIQAEVNLSAERFRSQTVAAQLALNNAERALSAAMSAAEKAVDKANVASERRFEGVNEFRAQLADIINTMMPRGETNTLITALENRVNDIKSVIDKGFTGVETSDKLGNQHWGYIVGAVGLIAVIVTAIVNIVHYAH